MRRNREKKKKSWVVHIDQWIEITRKDGVTVSKFYPTNQELEVIRLDSEPKPELIYRRLNFVDGVPPEYHWTAPSPRARRFGGHFLTRIKAEDWPELMALEKASGNTIVIPTPRPQPRPEQYGPCPCADCQANPDRFKP